MMILPREITKEIIEFARSIVDSAKLYQIRLVPGEVSKGSSYNVRKVIEESGGTLVKGWRIWLLPGKLLRAEAHSVWMSSWGLLVDLTPIGGGEKFSLFFEDPNMLESPGDHFIHSPQKNICGHPLVDNFIKISRIANEWSARQHRSCISLPDIPEQSLMKELYQQLILISITKNNHDNDL